MRKKHNEKLILGILVGTLIGVPLTLYGLDYFADNITTLVLIYLSALVTLGLLLLLVARFRERIWKRTFGVGQAGIQKVSETGIELADDISRGDAGEARSKAERLVKELAAWYAWISFRNWSVRTMVAIVLAFAGFVGSMLVFRQNDLMDQQKKLMAMQNELIVAQNDKIEIQSHLMESERRAALVFELSSILDEMDEELDALSATFEADSGMSLEAYHLSLKDSFPTTKTAIAELNERMAPYSATYSYFKEAEESTLQFYLSGLLVGRIIALNKAFKPYRYLDEQGKLTTSMRSPERGQMLISLIESGIDLSEILLKADFGYADLPGATFRSYGSNNEGFIALNYIDLSNAFLRGARFDMCTLANSVFSDVKGEDLTFYRSDLDNASFYRAELQGAYFSSCRMWGTAFEGANLNGTEFADCDLSGLEEMTESGVGAIFELCILPPRMAHPQTNLRGNYVYLQYGEDSDEYAYLKNDPNYRLDKVSPEDEDIVELEVFEEFTDLKNIRRVMHVDDGPFENPPIWD